MSADALIVDASGPVWHVTLNSPGRGNACSAGMVAALDGTLQEAASAGAQALVLRGAGRHFCTGFDLSNLAQESDDTLLARFVRIELMLQRLARAPFLTVAVAHGRAIGAGADVFTACAVRLAQADASFAFPGARGFGLVLGTRRLAQAVGPAVALEWVESGRTLTAEAALRAGLVTHAIGTPAEALVHERLHGDAALHHALRRAASPRSAQEDALDLRHLVESAARPGLRERIARYVEARLGPAPSTAHPA